MISRETRLLLITIVGSVLALWLLARIRFQDRPITPDPVPPVLAQLRPQSNFDDLARSVAEMRPAIAASVFALPSGEAALRIRPDAAVTLAPVDAGIRVAYDRPTGLTVARSTPADLPGLMPWVPRVLDYPRYLVCAELTDGRLALRPVFVGGLFETVNTLWSGNVWQLPDAAAVQPGTFVFTLEGAFAGLVIRHTESAAIVPATQLLQFVDQLLREGTQPPAEIGVSVQPLTPAIAAATGASTGVVVTSVEADGPAAAVLAPTDIIEAANGRTLATLDQWRAHVERLSAGETLSLRVRRDGAVHDVEVTAATDVESATRDAGPGAAAVPSDASRAPLGLRLRSVPKGGAEVIAVEPSSSAAAAGLQPGDIITVAGRQRNPTAAQVTGAYGALPNGSSLLVALTRGSGHHVVALKR